MTVTGWWIAQVERVSGDGWVAQGDGDESSCIESPQPSLLREADVDSQMGLDGGGSYLRDVEHTNDHRAAPIPTGTRQLL